MLDCGEGTLSQLIYCYQNNIDEILKKIKIIYITHLHGDHFFGIFNIINERERVLKEAGLTNDLYIIGPSLVLGIMREL